MSKGMFIFVLVVFPLVGALIVSERVRQIHDQRHRPFTLIDLNSGIQYNHLVPVGKVWDGYYRDVANGNLYNFKGTPYRLVAE